MKSRAPAAPRPSRAETLWAGVVLLVAIALAWHGTLSVPFLLDDLYSIVANPSLRHAGGLTEVFSPPPELGVGGRPFLNFTFALNYAAGGLEVRGYHLVNLLIHFGGSLVLFALVRRTLLTPPLRERFGSVAFSVALAIALGWSLHPLQTQSVTYISQRAESLMGCLYLLTSYCFVRSCASDRPLGWQIGAVSACLLGHLTKEVMVTAPLLVLLYDRTFVAGSFRAALSARFRFYLALAATWIVLPLSLANIGARGVGSGGVDSITYALTESRLVLDYLRLTLLPFPLIFDRDAVFVSSMAEAAPWLATLGLLLAGVVYLLVRHPRWGFLGAWFFLILAPTSSVVPIVLSPMAESRLYLPLIAVVAAIILLLYRVAGRHFWWAAFPLLLAATGLTLHRNRDYVSAENLWALTARQQPASARAHYNLGLAWLSKGKLAEAIPALETTLLLRPDHPAVEHLLANALASVGRLDEAAARYEHALRLHPDETTARANFATTLLKLGRLNDAAIQARLAVQQRPRDAVAHYTLGLVLAQQGETDPALAAYEAALRLSPDLLAAHLNTADLLNACGQFNAALAHFERAVALAPNDLSGHKGTILTLLAAGEADRAAHYAAELSQRFSASPDAFFLLAQAEIARGQPGAARAALERALQLRPGFPEASAALSQLPPAK